MRIHSMTATFGKLEGQSLTLKPGLNRIHAPNEWGKSTWCAFLMAMLYGVDTRAKSTRGNLADKDHYAPWSGSPMSGRMELDWQGRNITIERSTRGRIPLGCFRAYETETGAEVPELTAENCGQMLLGVERSVFQRSGFIRLSDLPVSGDDALRRRLNALVTTGDESGDGARLEQGLKELKNRCRYNRSGLLPQAEQERETLREMLRELEALGIQQEKLTRLSEENRQRQAKLQNHMAALDYEAAQTDAVRVEQAQQAWAAARERLEMLEEACARASRREEAEHQLELLEHHREQLHDFQTWQQSAPLPPELPKVPRAFVGMEPEEAVEEAEDDALLLEALDSPVWWILLLLSGVILLSGFVLLGLGVPALGAIGAILSLVLAGQGLVKKRSQDTERTELFRKYGSENPEAWVRLARNYETTVSRHRQARQDYRKSREELAARGEELKRQHTQLCGIRSIDEAEAFWREQLRPWRERSDAEAEVRRAQERYETLKAMARPMPEPAEQDDLTETREETTAALQEALLEQQQLQNRLGEIRGRMVSLGSEPEIRKKLYRLETRIGDLEQTYAALMLAQKTLGRASAELQRRFAPRIAEKARSLMARMTGGRYDRIRLDSDLSLQAGAAGETTLRDALWRSEGTMDQLYLSLRLAVAEELTADAPLVLDDALVRFDEERLAAVLEILAEIAEEKQVIVFSCQKRETEMHPEYK